MSTTMIPVEGDRGYVDAFGFFAKLRDTTMAALVRKALDNEYGEELRPILELSAAQRVAQTPQNIYTSNTPNPITNPATPALVASTKD